MAMTNEQMVQYIRRLQATLEQLARKEVAQVREETSYTTTRVRKEPLHAITRMEIPETKNTKRKGKVKNEVRVFGRVTQECGLKAYSGSLEVPKRSIRTILS